MSVLIRGMKMPESCYECVAGYGGFCFVASAESDGICPDHGRPDDCPLIELPAEHGRLIDVDEFKAWVKNFFDVHRYYHPHSKSTNIPSEEIYDILERMPTVIEAEVGGT